jgi:pyruvate dehydrogenase E1 component
MATAKPFPLFATRGDDVDPEETQDWLESIDSVLRVHGAERAHYLLECMIDHARRSGAYLPYSPNTAYLNTIPVGQQPNYPGDRGIERRIEAYIRWNALAMVVHANRKSSSTAATSRATHRLPRSTKSASTISARRRRSTAATSSISGPFVAGHLCARVSRGRLTRRISTTSVRKSSARLSSYPHPG